MRKSILNFVLKSQKVPKSRKSTLYSSVTLGWRKIYKAGAYREIKNNSYISAENKRLKFPSLNEQ